MRARYARQIREGILAARAPHRLRALWLMENALKRKPTLSMYAFIRTGDHMAAKRVAEEQ